MFVPIQSFFSFLLLGNALTSTSGTMLITPGDSVRPFLYIYLDILFIYLFFGHNTWHVES